MPARKASAKPCRAPTFVNPLQHLLERIKATPSRFGDLAFHKKLSDGLSTLKRASKGHQYAIPQTVGITPGRDGLDCLP